MARPSKAAERTRQIVQATIRAIAKYGYAGATLDRIAEESGLARGHVRHFVGNRQELIRQAAREYCLANSGGTFFWPSTIDSAAAAIAFLFSPEFIGDRDDNAVIFGFIEAARTDPEISNVLLAAYAGAEAELLGMLQREFPKLPAEELADAAFSIVSAAIYNAFLLDISEAAGSTARAAAAARRIYTNLTHRS